MPDTPAGMHCGARIYIWGPTKAFLPFSQASLSFVEDRPKKPDSEIVRYDRDFLLQFSLVRSHACLQGRCRPVPARGRCTHARGLKCSGAVA